jgi:hypothetical protein
MTSKKLKNEILRAYKSANEIMTLVEFQFSFLGDEAKRVLIDVLKDRIRKLQEELDHDKI